MASSRSARSNHRRQRFHGPEAGVALLHRLSSWLKIERQLAAGSTIAGGNRQQRVRTRQRTDLVRRLLEVIPDQQRLLLPSSGWWFWRALRWGGPGVLLGLLLAKL